MSGVRRAPENRREFLKKELVQEVTVPKRISHVQFGLMAADEVRASLDELAPASVNETCARLQIDASISQHFKSSSSLPLNLT